MRQLDNIDRGTPVFQHNAPDKGINLVITNGPTVGPAQPLQPGEPGFSWIIPVPTDPGYKNPISNTPIMGPVYNPDPFRLELP